MRLPTSIAVALIAVSAGLAMLAQPAVAQSVEAGAASQDADDDIVVTSLRRPEVLQDIPGSLTVFDGEAIERAGIDSLRGIADRTPNFGILDNYRPGLERFQLRGIITPQVGDPPLAFVIDGVTAPDPEFATQPLFDIERVEVLRGAQGALYGRSAVGGTVNIVTRAPADAFEGSISGGYESGDTRRFSAIVSGPIAAPLRFRLGGYRLDSDGLIENRYLGGGADYRHELGVGASLAADLGARTTLDLRGQYGHARDGIGYYDAVSASRASIEDFSVGDTQNVAGVNRRESYYLSSKLEHRFAAATLVLAGGYFHARDAGIADGDLVALPSDGVSFFPSVQRALDDLDAWTAEARLTSTGSGPLRWAVGSFYQDRRKFSTFSVYGDPDGTRLLTERDIDPALLQFAIFDRQRSRTWALSSEVSYDLGEGFEATVAGRYDRDLRSSVDPRDAATTAASASFARFQPKASLAYRAAPGLLVYGGYSRGFRSGGFNQFSPLIPRDFAAEVTDSYELGFKASALGERLTVNGALFRNAQRNAQITRFNPASFTLENVAIDDVRSQGAELEVALRPVAGLRLGYAGGFTDSRIQAFAANPAVIGSAMPYVPEFTSAFSLDYERGLSQATRLWAHAGYRLMGPRSFTLDFPGLKSATHDFADLRIGIRHRGWDVAAFGENLFDERQPEDIFAVFNGAVELARQPNRPRRFGLELRYRYQRVAD